MRIVLIVSDTFRYDHLGLGGAGKAFTPELDELISDALLFERYVISSFPTIPNREDMITGRYGFPLHGWQPLDPKVRPLAQVLRENGYVTQLIADTPHLMRGRADFARGCTGSVWIRGQEGDIPLTRMNYPIEYAMPPEKTRRKPVVFGRHLVDINKWTNHWWRHEEDTFAARTCRAACAWLEDNHETRDFFLWVDLFDPHEPWNSPEYLVRRYDPDYQGPPMLHPNYGHASEYTEAELRNLAAHYAGEVTLVSKHVGRVLRTMKDVGIWDDTLVLFTTDHGMYLGEHDRTGKSNLSDLDERGEWPLYEEITRIPLAIRGPGLGRGRTKALAQPVDVVPTLLDLAGLSGAMDVHGESLVPILKGSASETSRRYAFSAAAPFAGEGPGWATVTDSDGKWTYLAGGRPEEGPELYHTADDPGQLRNVIGENADVAREMDESLREVVKSVRGEAE